MCDLMILQYSELQCPFSRTFIRNIVKDLEVKFMHVFKWLQPKYIIGKDQKHNDGSKHI